MRRLWFLGETRKDVATAWGIGAGSVTNIVNEWTKGLQESDIEGVRELAVQLKKEGSTLAELTSIYRRHSYIKKLGVDEDQIEFLIVNLLDGVKSVPQEKVTGLVIQLFELSESESIAPVDVPNYVKQKMEVKQILEDQIQQAGATLHHKNVDIQTVEEFRKLKDELKKHGLSLAPL